MTAQSPVVVVPAVVDVVPDAAPPAALFSDEEPHAASARNPVLRPEYPTSLSSFRRSIIVSRSNLRPWSKMSSSGLARGRPWYDARRSDFS
jgi:hypothetical protein